MAQTITSNDLGKDDANGPGNQAPSQTAPPAGQGNPAPSAGAVNTGSGPSTIQNPNTQKGTGYTNIQNVINANKGNQLGSAVGNNIQQVGNAAQNNLKSAQNQFQTDTANNQFNTDANNQVVQNVINDPTKYANTGNNDVNSQAGSQFQTLISGQYQGPTALSNADQIQNQANNAKQLAGSLNTNAGRVGVLNQVVGSPQYSQGQQNLDSLLLAQSNSPQIQEAKRQALMLQGKVNTGIAGAAAQGQQNTNVAQGYGQNVQNQLGQNLTNLDTNLTNQATAAGTQRDTDYQKAIADYKSGNVTQDEANLLGLTQGMNVYNTLNDPTAFLTENPLAASAQNVASADQYAKLQALQTLSGGYGTTAQGVLAKYNDPTQAGAFAAAPEYTANNGNFVNTLQNTAQQYNSTLEQPTQAVNQAQEMVGIWANPSLSPQQKIAAIQQKYPGAFNSGATYDQNAQWASNNLASQKANLASVQAGLNAQYGTQETINIQQPQPAQSAYPSLIPQNGSDLEKFPTVS